MSIEESSVEKACEWMVENASKAAQARAQREYLSEYRKALKAQIMQEHADLPIGAQEREAYADARYTELLGALKGAVEADERMRWLLTAAETKISAWQTQCRMQRT